MQRVVSGTLRRLHQNKKVRFIVAGLLNTAADFLVFNTVLFAFKTHLWVANMCSTSVAMIVSFIINKKAVFKDTKGFSHRQFIAFVVVTAVGLWGLQTGAVLAISHSIKQFVHGSFAHWLAPNIAKAAAVVLSAVWNYFWYDRVIFATRQAKGIKLTEWM